MRLWLLALAGCAWVAPDAHIEELRRVWALEVSAQPLQPCEGVEIVASTAFEVPPGTTVSWAIQGSGGARLRDGSIEVAQVAEGDRWVARVETSALSAAVFEGFDEACAEGCELVLTVPLDDVELVATTPLERSDVPGLPGVALTSGASLTGVLYVEDEPELIAAEPAVGWTVTAEACPDAGPCLESAFNAGLARTLPLAACGDRVDETGWTLSLRLDRADCDATFARSAPIPVRFATADCDGDGHLLPDDCDDLDPGVSWFAVYVDVDGDGFGAGDPFPGCEGDGVLVDGDCDDDAVSGVDIHPGATDIPCDGIDQDCDGADAQITYQVWPTDEDQDGYGAIGTPFESRTGCPAPTDALAGDDCDDTEPSVNPGLPEDWSDRLDNDCDGVSRLPAFSNDTRGLQVAFVDTLTQVLSVEEIEFGARFDQPDVTGPFVVGEFTGDGLLDVAHAGAPGQLQWRAGVPDGGLPLPTPSVPQAMEITLPDGQVVTALALADLDGDGVQDLVALTDDGTAPFLRAFGGGSPFGTVNTLVELPLDGLDVKHLAAAHLNDDCFEDLVVWGGSGIHVVRGADDPASLDLEQVTSERVEAVVFADLDGDGPLDLVASHTDKVESYALQEVPGLAADDSTVYTGTFSVVAARGGAEPLVAVSVPYVPGVGESDPPVARVLVLMEDGGTWEPVATTDILSDVSALAFGDFDGSGIPDLFIGTVEDDAVSQPYGRRNQILFDVTGSTPIRGMLPDLFAASFAVPVRRDALQRDDLVVTRRVDDPLQGGAFAYHYTDVTAPPAEDGVVGNQFVTFGHRVDQPPVVLGNADAQARMFPPVCVP